MRWLWASYMHDTNISVVEVALHRDALLPLNLNLILSKLLYLILMFSKFNPCSLWDLHD